MKLSLVSRKINRLILILEDQDDSSDLTNFRDLINILILGRTERAISLTP